MDFLRQCRIGTAVCNQNNGVAIAVGGFQGYGLFF
jgi:hypothetical protein